jgi:uncharacterized membrane protein YcaP (DUF421 family)
MKKEDVRFGDMARLFLGDAPPEFLIEVFLRTLLIFLFLLFVVRIMGKRMTAQLTIIEFAVMLTLGAIAAPPMQLPDRGLVPGIVVMICALGFQRGISYFSIKRARVEEITQGTASLLVKNGIIETKKITKLRITHEQLFSHIRQKGIYNLAQVKRAYFEGCGIISIYYEDNGRYGLPTLPLDEVDSLEQTRSNTFSACTNCGHTQVGNDTACNNCNHHQWTPAII